MNRGFFASLFDFSFQSLITLSVIRLVYGLSMALSALLALGVFKSLGVVWGLFVGPVVFLSVVVYCRVLLELTETAARKPPPLGVGRKGGFLPRIDGFVL